MSLEETLLALVVIIAREHTANFGGMHQPFVSPKLSCPSCQALVKIREDLQYRVAQEDRL